MREQTGFPLLLQGVVLTPCSASVNVASTQGTFQKGRGNIMWLDFIPGEETEVGGNTVLIAGGAVNIIQEFSVQLFRFNIAPFLHRFIKTCIKDGQTYNVTLNNTANVTAPADFKGFLHIYYENPYDTPQWQQKMLAGLLTLQRQSYHFTLMGLSATRISTGTTTVPADQGDVCGIAVTYEGVQTAYTFPADIIDVNFSVHVNGVAVIMNACAYIALISCTRRMITFPIAIPRESEIVLTVSDLQNSSQTGQWCLTLFFDDDKLSR